MTPTGSDGGSFWLAMILPALVVAIAVVAMVFFLRREEREVGIASFPSQTPSQSVQALSDTAETLPSRSRTEVLGAVLRSLAPTLVDDERRVMDEMVKAGGEILQSDLPRMTDLSKATASKAIHGLEVRGIVVRERHKWTYWCKVNPRLVERARVAEPDLERPTPTTV